ncbi:MAG: poly-beta,6-N-acetyl-D-glucosamine synthase [Actinomycetota bacterium]|nr:poly-beta,6-N-acetyl-D-glucosamine synthase [Actinomycetota bacterium]
MDQRAEERGLPPLTAAAVPVPPPPASEAAPTNGARPAPARPQPPVANIAVLIPTHNDGGTIEPLLRRVLSEPGVGDVVVVASGCDDDTVSLVSEAAAGDSRVQLFVEAERSGKAAAINFGMEQRLRLPYVVIISGDVLPEPGAVSLLVDALAQPAVGLAGGRPVPDNPPSTAMGHASHLLWRLHHRVALQQPKLGEMIAIRAEAIVSLPRTSVDEACFQSLLETAGWKSRYVPEALVGNRGPCTVRDFVRQRRQIHTGHLWLRHREHYSVPSLRLGLILREFWHDLATEPRALRPRPLALTAGTVALEASARLLARLDYLKGRENVVWAMVKSTKGGTPGPNGLGPRRG